MEKVDPKALAQWQALFSAGLYAQCKQLSENLTRLCPSDATSWELLALGSAYSAERRRANEAVSTALQISGNNPTTLERSALALAKLGDKRALGLFAACLKLNPPGASAWLNAAEVFLTYGMWEDALTAAGKAAAIAPGLPNAQLAFGNALMAVGRLWEARRAIETAVQLNPDFAPAHQSLGVLRKREGDGSAAIDSFRRAVACDPRSIESHINLGSELCMAGDLEGSIGHSRKAIGLDPDRGEAWSNLLYALSHFEGISKEQLAEEHFRFGEHFERAYRGRAPVWTNTLDPARRLRVGYVSGDLRLHPVVPFIEPIWRGLDRSQFEILVYYTHPSADAVTERLKGLVEKWADVFTLTDDELEARILADSVDILVDLSGHTAFNRLPLFARKPAPVQVSVIGYPGTTGLRAIDYRFISVEYGSLETLAPQFSEKLLQTQGGSVFCPEGDIPPVSPAPCAQAGYLTLGSFNRVSKIGRECLRAWARLLVAVPSSRLLIAAASNTEERRRIAGVLGSAGVEESRLSFFPRLALIDYLHLHSKVDIALDTFPYSSGSTASHALWMGVPTLTMRGDRFAQRSCGALLAHHGLLDFIADDEERLCELARHWAENLSSLADLRSGLRASVANKVHQNTVNAPRVLGAAFREIWAAFCSSRLSAGNGLS